MQAAIMAAGKGKRIAEVTSGEPKCFLRINGRRIIDHQLIMLQRLDINELIMVIGYQKKRFEREYANRGITFVHNPFYETTNVLTSFWFALPYITDSFIYLHADTIFEPEILNKLVTVEGDIVLPIDRHKCGEEEMKVRLNGQTIIEISKTMPLQETDGEFIGIAKVSKNALPVVGKYTEELIEQGQFGCFFEAVIQLIINNNDLHVNSLDISGLAWNEIDYKTDYEEAKQIFADLEF